MTFIETYTGTRFTPLAPKTKAVHLIDIAHALSHQCRFSGHVREFYSVAEHCVRVSWLLEDQFLASKAVRLWGLLHDASEAYLVDLPSPLKNADAFKGYRRAEKRVMRAICKHFDLSLDEPEEVRAADAILLATEARDLMPYEPVHWGGLTAEPLEAQIVPWTSREAKKKFLERFMECRVPS